MANDEMTTRAPDTGLRIRTEVTARPAGADAGPAHAEIVCRDVNLAAIRLRNRLQGRYRGLEA